VKTFIRLMSATITVNQSPIAIVISMSSGFSPPDPHQGSAPVPRWGTSVPSPPVLSLSETNFWLHVHHERGQVFFLIFPTPELCRKCGDNAPKGREYVSESVSICGFVSRIQIKLIRHWF